MLELLDYWRDHPPVHELVAAFLGVKPRPIALQPTSSHDPSGIGALIAMHPNGIVPVNR